MLNPQARERAYVLAVLDAAILFLVFIAAFAARLLAPELLWDRASPIEFGVHFQTLVLGVPLFWVLASAEGLYGPLSALSRKSVVARLGRVFLYESALLGLAIFIFQAKLFSRAVFAMFIALAFAALVAEKLLVRASAMNPRADSGRRRNVLIVGVGAEGREMGERLVLRPEFGLRIVGYVCGPGEEEPAQAVGPVLGDVLDLKRIVEEEVVDDVVFALPFTKLLACEREIAWCEEVGTTLHLKVDFVRTILSRTYPTDLEGIPMLTLASTPRDPVSLAVKRTMDIGLSAAALAVLSPVLLTAALLVVGTSGGGLLFRQRRVGLNGRTFTLYKFRSMYREAERHRTELLERNEMSGPVFKIRDDPRVTPVGRWLRRFSLDELPQLWNVLRGDLSLVGPRPPIPEEVRGYERWQRRRLSVKPGITCLWQVSGRNRIDFEEWMRLDLSYIDNWSLKLDLQILLRTVPAVVFARGAH